MKDINCLSIAMVEDDPAVRERFTKLLAPHSDLRVDSVFENGGDAMRWLKANEPDVLLCDLGLPDCSGLEVIRCCAALHPACEIMVITMFGDEQNVLAAIQAGAKGYILKGDIGNNLADTVRTLTTGGSPMSPIIARQVLQKFFPGANGKSSAPAESNRAQDQLSAREIEVLDLISRGYTYAESARLLSITLHTLQGYIKTIYSKLAVHSRTEAIFEAQRLGLLGTGNHMR